MRPFAPLFATRTGWRVAVLTALAGLVASGLLALDLRREADARHRAGVDALADRVAGRVAREIDLALALHGAVAAKVAASPDLGPAEYRAFVSTLRMTELLPSVRAMAYAPLVPAENLPRLSEALNRDPRRAELGYPPFAPWPEGARESYAPLVLVEPHEGNARVFSFDLMSNPERRNAVARAIAAGTPQSSAPVVLTQDAERGSPGVLVVRAVKDGGRAIGIVAMGVTIERLLDPLILGEGIPGAFVTIDDIGTPMAAAAAAGVFRAGGSGGIGAARTIDVAGRVWRIRSGFPAQGGAPHAAIAGVLAAALSLVGAFALGRILDDRERLGRDAVRKTRALLAANRKVRLKARELARANAVKSEFLSRLGHELRTPLNAVLGFAELMRAGVGGTLAPRQAGYAKDILDSGRHLLDLINRLLDVLKLERGSEPLERVAFDAGAEIDVVVAMLAPSAMARGIALDNLRDKEPPRALGDALAFRQITANLIENAIKFTPDGGRVVVLFGPRSGKLALAVDDTGVGIPGEHLTRIFEPFHQVETGDARRFGGAGLGLAIVAGLASRMGAAVRVESEPGKGSRFVVELPLAPAPALALAA